MSTTQRRQDTVYFARVAGTALHKIGVSSDPERRVGEFGPPCEVLHTVTTPIPHKVESQLLERLSDHISGGREWLKLPDSLVESVPAMMESVSEKVSKGAPIKDAPRSPEPKETYTAEEVADRLDRHTESIRRNLRKGQLEGEKWSGKWVVTDDALREWLPGAIYEQAFAPAKTEADE